MPWIAAIWGPDDAALAGLGPVALRRALADQGRYRAGDPFDVFLRGEGARPDGELSALGDRVRAWTVREHRRREGDPACEVTMVALVRRRPDLTRVEFARHWTERHAPLALRHHVLLADYTQLVVVQSLVAGTDEVDGVAALGFATRTDFEEGFYDSDAGRQRIQEDVRRFMAGPGPDTTLLAPVGSG